LEQVFNDFVEFFSKEENRVIGLVVGLFAAFIAYKVASSLMKITAMLVVVAIMLFFAYPYVQGSSGTVEKASSKTGQALSQMEGEVLNGKGKAKEGIKKPADKAAELYDSAKETIGNALSKVGDSLNSKE